MLLSETMKLWKPFIPPLMRPCQLLLLQALQQRHDLNGQCWGQFCPSAPTDILWLAIWAKRWMASRLRWRLFWTLFSFLSKRIYSISDEIKHIHGNHFMFTAYLIRAQDWGSYTPAIQNSSLKSQVSGAKTNSVFLKKSHLKKKSPILLNHNLWKIMCVLFYILNYRNI